MAEKSGINRTFAEIFNKKIKDFFMQQITKERRTMIDGSRLMIESLARAGADAFIGYPITPANLLYLYGSQRMEMLAAPDEISTLQWMSGLSSIGRIPITATSFPGFALMLESINMAYMMELPMVIILVQRLGPATGTATNGAQGDLLLLQGMISGGHPIPVLCTSTFEDSWTLSAEAVSLAVKMRTPVILLTSKEEVMTHKSFDMNTLPEIEKVDHKFYDKDCEYKSYKPTDLVPDFLPLTQNRYQVRINASTHDQSGILQHSTDEALDNTRRLEEKMHHRMKCHLRYDYDALEDSETLVISYGITASAARNAAASLRSDGEKVSLLVPKTLLPVPDVYLEIINQYSKVVIAEENMNNQFGTLLYGNNKPANMRFVGALGKMITPQQIIEEVKA
jgi:2-oxoglutarate/2-oxoacid ferredoxin oxidoreductase subunit alpha